MYICIIKQLKFKKRKKIMAVELNPKGKKILTALAIILVLGGGYFLASSKGWLDGIFKTSVSISAGDLPDLPTAPKDAVTAGLVFAGIPTTSVSSKSLPEVTGNILGWNSQLGLLLANGGPVTTEGSLMEKAGVKLSLSRQDDMVKAREDLIKFAEDFKSNGTSAKGLQFFTMMGDGAPVVISALNKLLEKIDPSYKAIIVGSAGRSDGEDAFLAPVSVKADPQKARGLLVSTVVLDGDWNIVVKWAQSNGIPINTDDSTYDPNAINFLNTADNEKAGEAFIAATEEERPEVINGKKTGKSVKVKVNATSVWTPVDVSVVEKRGGVVRIASTHEYSAQMPNVIITLNAWAEANRPTVEAILKGMTDGGDQVKSFSAALNKGGDVADQVFGGGKGGAWWVKYSKGITQVDKTGALQVELGGSKQFNLADNLALFGIENGNNIYATVYKVFGGFALKYYPERFEKFTDPADVIDVTYLKAVAAKATVKTSADKQHYSTSESLSSVTASKAWAIEFALGSADLSPNAEADLEEIYDDLVVSGGLKVIVEGHTDNTGSESINQTLSEARANSVKRWLQKRGGESFPENRVIVKGLGSSVSVATNATSAGRAKNRRVVVKQGI